MRKTISITYPAGPDTVATMLADPGFQHGRVDGRGLERVKVDVAVRDGGFVASVSGVLPADGLPAAARRLVRAPLAFTVNESWGAPGAEGRRSGRVSAEVSGAPVRVSATSTMSAQGASTLVTLDLSLDIAIPLMGRALEDKAMGYVDAVVADEQRRAETWLRDH